MPFLFKLPDELLFETLYCWCFLKELALLDSALCQKSFRKVLFNLFRSHHFVASNHDKNTMRYQCIKWMALRRLRSSCFSIFDSYFRFRESQWDSLEIDASRVTSLIIRHENKRKLLRLDHMNWIWPHFLRSLFGLSHLELHTSSSRISNKLFRSIYKSDISYLTVLVIDRLTDMILEMIADTCKQLIRFEGTVSSGGCEIKFMTRLCLNNKSTLEKLIIRKCFWRDFAKRLIETVTTHCTEIITFAITGVDDFIELLVDDQILLNFKLPHNKIIFDIAKTKNNAIRYELTKQEVNMGVMTVTYPSDIYEYDVCEQTSVQLEYAQTVQYVHIKHSYPSNPKWIDAMMKWHHPNVWLTNDMHMMTLSSELLIIANEIRIAECQQCLDTNIADLTELIDITRGYLHLVTGKLYCIKALSRLSFRSLVNLFHKIMVNTGFGCDLFTDEELEYYRQKPNNVEKADKIHFLSKVIRLLSVHLSMHIDLNPAKVVSGLECEKTNLFLQLLVIAAKYQPDSNSAVQSVLCEYAVEDTIEHMLNILHL